MMKDEGSNQVLKDFRADVRKASTQSLIAMKSKEKVDWRKATINRELFRRGGFGLVRKVPDQT